MQRLEPLTFEPVYQDYVWGGRRILEKFGRSFTPTPCAESWEISDRLEARSLVTKGPFAGTTLTELIEIYGAKLLGEGRQEKRFPLLIKIIDARESLSVQVHPSEESSERFGGEPKSEIWYLLEGGPLYAGFQRPIQRNELLQAVRENRVQELLRKFDVKPGDALFIPGGRIHAIGAGCMMLEIQQNSNSTYRIYDWGRKGRALHLGEALQCLKLDDTSAALAQPVCLEKNEIQTRWEIASTLFFSLEKIESKIPWRQFSTPQTFQVFFHMETAETTLLPADSEPLDLPPGTFLRIFV